MANKKNLHYHIGKKLVENSFYAFDTEEKKEMVDNFLMEHITNELKKNGVTNVPKDDDIIDRFELLYLSTPVTERKDLATEYTHYALSMIGNIQDYSVIWMIDKDEELISDAKLCVINDKLDKIITHDETDPVRIFSTVYDYFRTGELDKSKQKKYEIR
ncbi:MAG: hypothetical protein PHQ64_03325 [Bacilli bacterium]|nr:hypothetical protein [Bacilli bacterium]